METLIRLLLLKQSDQGLCCLPMSVLEILEHLLTYGIFHPVGFSRVEWIKYFSLQVRIFSHCISVCEECRSYVLVICKLLGRPGYRRDIEQGNGLLSSPAMQGKCWLVLVLFRDFCCPLINNANSLDVLLVLIWIQTVWHLERIFLKKSANDTKA